MSNADRLRSRHGLPMSDRLVGIGLVEQHAMSTSSQPSLAHPGQWIRSDTIRYTQQGATFPKFELCPPDNPRATHFEIKIHTNHTTTDPHNPPSLTKKPPPRDRRTTPRPYERPDVHFRLQHLPNPGPIRHGRVLPTHANHSIPHSRPDFKTQLGRSIFNY
jgi:hypothetical protein